MLRFVLAMILSLPLLPAATITLTSGVPAEFRFGSISNPVYFPPEEIDTFVYTTAVPSTIRITDSGYEGDSFRFTINGVSYLTTRVPGASDEIGSRSFETSWADPHLDHGIAYVGPGTHLITIEQLAESFNTYVSDDGAGFIQADEGVPEPSSLLLAGCAVGAGIALRMRVRTGRAL